jgi:hypothetical protein
MICLHFLFLLFSSLAPLSQSFTCVTNYPARTKKLFGARVHPTVHFEDRFSRWRFLQQLLDEESDEHRTNLLLGEVLREYLNGPKHSDTTVPEHTEQRVSAVQAIIDTTLPDGSIPALPKCDSLLFDLLESTLPDPQEEEEAYKSNWDMIMEIHGREAVKVNEQAGEISWKTSCLVARVLLFYDFLTND